MNLSPKTILFGAVGFFVAVIGLIVTLSSFYTVPDGSRGLSFTFGKLEKMTEPGLHFKVPFVESYKIVDVLTKKGDSPASAGTKDLQTVNAKVSFNWTYQIDQLETIYSTHGLDLESKVIDPRVQEAVKGVVAKYSAEELISKRQEIKDKITTNLKTMVSKYGVKLDAVQITDFAFNRKFVEAIERKQIAEQNALTAKNDLERIKVEAQQKIENAKAEAKQIQIQAEAIRKQGGKEYVQLQWIEKWNGVQPTHMLAKDAQFMVR